ncbi:transmembrane protein 230 [Anolis carolinensis]|uniref:transmembrane protein 230 n=1 Tax=Anolis carolinensis TaxID=28377 RepID=UPI002F2B3DE4
MPSRSSLAASAPGSKVKYSKLSCNDDGYIDLQFKKSPPKIPYKAIALATLLFLIGTLLIVIGGLLLAGYISHAVGCLDVMLCCNDRAVEAHLTGMMDVDKLTSLLKKVTGSNARSTDWSLFKEFMKI